MFLTPSLRSLSYSPALRSFDRSFERFIGDTVQPSVRTSQRFTEDETSWTLSLDLPGLSREQLTITIEDSVLRIASTDDAARKVKLAYEFPLAIDTQASSAKLEHGVLTLVVGKTVPQKTSTTLSIA
ncbi:Hsp20/alpha crystallin family protein [Comamonadaceae bacterium PP-2]